MKWPLSACCSIRAMRMRDAKLFWRSVYPFATIGCYQTSDGPIMISASNLRQQRRLWELLGRPDLVKTRNGDRIQDYPREAEALAALIATKTAVEWETLLRAGRVPVSRVQRMEDMLTDEHTQARTCIQTVSDCAEALDGLRVPVAAFKSTKGAPRLVSPPQPVGAQNKEILGELGYSARELQEFVNMGAI